MRPEISEELAAEVDDRVRSEVRVPPDRLTFQDRVRILLEEYDEASASVDELRERVEELEAELEEERDQEQTTTQTTNTSTRSSPGFSSSSRR
jgi:polyhydroxyalkanoate synthesis regulator phasin